MNLCRGVGQFQSGGWISFRAAGTISPPQTMTLHFEVHPSMTAGPMTIQGIAFRSWRPFRRGGGARVSEVWMQEVGPATFVSPATLGRPAGGSQVLQGAYSLPSGPIDAVLSVDTVSRAFDQFNVEVPFQQSFPYSGTGNLHIWMMITGDPGVTEYEVDYAGDIGDLRQASLLPPAPNNFPCSMGFPFYGSQWGTSSVNPSVVVGQCPIMGLLGTLSTSNVSPSLTAFGEPMVGRALDVRGSRVPVSTTITLGIGEWMPDFVTLGSCLGHVNPTVGMVNATSDAWGRVQWELEVPLDRTLLSTIFGLQAIVASNGTLTNGLRLTIGGGL